MKISMKDNRGFTLVELAIVMIIIGLLIGGVLKGQQLVDNAKVTATLAQVKAYQAALNTFADTYGSMPGDVSNARSRIANCDDDSSCENGDGDGFIEMGDSLSPVWDATIPDDGSGEQTQAWKHLALAGLITGVNSSADPGVASDLVWGGTNPASSLRGGFEMYYDTDFGDGGNDPGPSASGLVLRLSNSGLSGGAPAMGTAGAESATPTQAATIDRKLDDGEPSEGIVFANDGCKVGDVVAGAYDEQVDQRNCVVFFALDS